MIANATPHYLLYSEAHIENDDRRWRFVLQHQDGTEILEAEDQEPLLPPDRLELLAVLRGLESLEQPSRVTLLTPSRYVRHGLVYGLQEWRGNEWNWEYFGEMIPIKNGDLWKRLDHALKIHRVDLQPIRADVAHPLLSGPHFSMKRLNENASEAGLYLDGDKSHDLSHEQEEITPKCSYEDSVPNKLKRKTRTKKPAEIKSEGAWWRSARNKWQKNLTDLGNNLRGLGSNITSCSVPEKREAEDY